MTVTSAFELFTIGIGPSSSHTVGPMRAARLFAERLASTELRTRASRVRCTLYGSLAFTGRGHGTDRAVVAGLEGETPEDVDPERIVARAREVFDTGRLRLLGRDEIEFGSRDLVFEKRQRLPGHPNGMVFVAEAADASELERRTYYSVGGGFVLSGDRALAFAPADIPYDFATADELLAHADRTGLSFSGLMYTNECARSNPAAVDDGLARIWRAMEDCVARGCAAEGVLPGRLCVKRRAASLVRQLEQEQQDDPLCRLEWVSAFALAVNEENAAGHRVVTAPTNGAAGIVPAVLHYYVRFVPGADAGGVNRFLLAAAAVGSLIKEGASISGADVGCQGEVGSACAMAAAGLAEVLGGSPRQVENAAEIALEHNLGLTCDPVAGLVQIPCIERNAIGAVKAITATRIALRGDGTHHVSLDQAIKTLRTTGADMSEKYKETARGGLALNVIEC